MAPTTEGPNIPDPEFYPNPNVDPPPLPDSTPEEDLTQPVPLGEPADEGFVIHEEDPEYGPEQASGH